MTEGHKKKYREQLLKLAGELQHDAWSVEDQAREPAGGQAGGNLSNAPMHLADSGTDQNLQELNSVLLENERYLLNETLAALERFELGTFGRCERCGEMIDERRLDAIPYSRTCVKCSGLVDEGPELNVDIGRPTVETETIAGEDKLTVRTETESSPDEEEVRRRTRKRPPRRQRSDVHAAGSAGGGTAAGGLAGSNVGRGDPVEELESATGSSQFDVEDESWPESAAESGRGGGAVGGTPARKRASSNRAKE